MFRKKKLLYITYDGLTDPLGHSQIIPYLIGISFAGYDVTVLSCEKRKIYRQKKNKVKRILKLSNISWKKKFYTKKPPVLSTLWDLYRMKSKAVSLHSKHNFDMVHCRSILSAWIGSKLQDEQTKLVFDIRGFWADERVEGGLWDQNRWIYRRIFNYFKGLESKLFRKSDHIITLTQKAKEHILSQYSSLSEKKITVIPCSVDLVEFDPKNIDEANIERKKKLLGIASNDFVLGYIGSLGTRYLSEEMLCFFAELKQSIPQSKFLIICNVGEETLMDKAKKMDLHNSIITYKADYSEIPLLISLFDIAVYFIKAGFSGLAVSPTKQSEILSMGKPVVTNTGIGDSDQILLENKCGLLLKDFSQESYRQTVGEISTLLEKSSDIYRNVAKNHFSMESAVKNYVSVYKQLF